MTIMGTFTQRGDNGANRLESLRDFAQYREITDIMTVGSAGSKFVYVVVYNVEDTQAMAQVTGGLYDFMDFLSEDDLKAYNNMSDRVRNKLGAYSNKYHTQG